MYSCVKFSENRLTTGSVSRNLANTVTRISTQDLTLPSNGAIEYATPDPASLV